MLPYAGGACDTGPVPGDDRTIGEQITDLLAGQARVTHGSINVLVTDGVAELWGWVESEDERKAKRVAANGAAGVCAVEDHPGLVRPWIWGA